LLPPLTDEGVLPPGVHVAELDEVNTRFGMGNSQRVAVAARLRRVLELAQRTLKLRRIFVWGSYVTARAEPRDVDVMLVMSADFLTELCDEQVHKVFDCELAESELGATVLWAREDVPAELLQAFLDQWQIGRDGRQRGIVEVIL
jgi:hypothetical protein